jgi:F-type H+-transporting ATPase subunit b
MKNPAVRWLPAVLVAISALPALASEAAAEADKPSLLLPDPGAAIWSMVLFGLLLLVLGKFVWPPILKGLQAREEKIRGDITDAQTANAKAQQTLAEYELKVAEAHADVRKMLEQARADADAARAKLIADAETEAAHQRQRATDEIRLAKQQAVQDMYAHAAELATAVAGKMLARQIDDTDVQRLIDQSLDEMGKTG